MSPSAAPRRLFVSKDEHKFSCAHMTLFPDGTKERLHGHNFRVSVVVELASDRGFLDFARLKAVLASLCAELREHLLMPSLAKEVRVVSSSGESTEMEVAGKKYVVPTDDLVWLPVRNVVVESLAEYLWGRVMAQVRSDLLAADAVALEVSVTEGPGQGATFRGSVED